MTWFIYAILCAFAEAIKDIYSKKGLKNLDPLVVTWVFFVVPSILISPFLFYTGIPEIKPDFFLWLFCHGTLYGMSVVLYMKAISLSPLSLTIPLIMFTPVFMLLTSPLVLGEIPRLTGFIGTILIVIGSYLLNSRGNESGLFGPFKALSVNSGSRLMLLVAFIWSLTSVIDKLGVRSASPIFWGVSVYLFISLYLTIFLFYKKRFNIHELILNYKVLGLIGAFNAMQAVTYLMALNSGLAIYVLSVKRTSVLMVVVFSALVFKETNIRERMFASFLMLIGVVFISFSK
jgi:uncharacterized membrane protein